MPPLNNIACALEFGLNVRREDAFIPRIFSRRESSNDEGVSSSLSVEKNLSIMAEGLVSCDDTTVGPLLPSVDNNRCTGLVLLMIAFILFSNNLKLHELVEIPGMIENKFKMLELVFKLPDGYGLWS